ncbi:hypothetical protein [Psychrobacter sanguinis]|uniref:hypothetical protein n=1 Tax=Psychrobacter sanguinis TaxID=861445 RepID=UPI001D108632|nr:hypothetical protein [Psychrobacter sanguinis]MCC3344511.1 hypothetical protein [Psychrobacter sanguinis]
MKLTLSDGSVISGGDLISAIYRTDLVPVPVSLELVVKATDQLRPLLKIGDKIIAADATSLTIVKSQHINMQLAKAGKRVGGLMIIAVLSGCEPLLSVASRATSLNNTSFNEVYRALGAKIRLKGDIKLNQFICLKGQLPTKRIAIALQKEASVTAYQGGNMSVVRINDLFKGQAAMYDKSALQWIDNPHILTHGNTNYLSIDDNGSDIVGTPFENKQIGYYPRADARELQNLRRILVTRAKMVRQLDDQIMAGNLIGVNDGTKTENLVVLTAAHRYDTGALGGRPIMATQAWLAQLEGQK